MKYILSQKEYDKLIIEGKEQTKILQDLCTKVANHMPVPVRWRKTDLRPWGCILNEQEEGDDYYVSCCDECPVRRICPSKEKRFSK